MYQLQRHEQPEKVVVKLSELEEQVYSFFLFLLQDDDGQTFFLGEGT